jgi:hypothetical protein
MKSSATALRSAMLGLETAKAISRPAQHGMRWSVDEVKNLLLEIRRKMSISEIAYQHNRTVTSINLKLRALAVDYHFSENWTVEKIKKATGLTDSVIMNAIEKHKQKEASVSIVQQEEEQEQEEQQEQTNVATQDHQVDPADSSHQEPTMKEMMVVLLNMQETMKRLAPEEPEPTMRDLMKVATDIKRRMNDLLEKVQ